MAATISAGTKRLWILALLLGCWFLLIAARLIQLQIFDYGDYLRRADRQQQRTLEVGAQRGVIFDRHGNPLAMSVQVDSIFAVPAEIPDPQNTASLLGRILGEDPQELETHLRSGHNFSWVARKVAPEAAGRIRAMNLKGIYFEKEPKRFYPNHELAAQVLGYVGMDDEGLGGIERAYDGELRGHPGTMLVSMDARRQWFGRIERQPVAGENVVLTLDERIQYIAEQELERALERTHARAGTVIVQDPHSGEILTLASRPGFDANFFYKYPAAALNDRAVSDVYEPGSTFKLVTLSAALEEHLTTPQEVIDCQNGAIKIGSRRIHDHAVFGDLTVSEILMHSSDVGAIKIGLRLGDERLDQFIRAYGFGARTGIELPGESRGLTRPVERWSKTSIGAISMGQEIGVTPLQLVSMVSTIANDGIYNAPRIVAGQLTGVADEHLKTVVFHPAGERRVISTLTAAEMRKMMEGVVLYGTGRLALVEGYTSAGKTGTAQKADPTTGTYSRTDFIASFTGFAPVNSPAITILVVLDSPRGLHEGGEVAAPVFANIAQKTLAYLNVPRDAPLTGKRRQLLLAAARIAPAELADGSERLGDWVGGSWKTEDFDPPVLSAAAAPPPAAVERVAAPVRAPRPTALQLPSRVASMPPNGTVVLDMGSRVVVPTLIGLPMREALERAEAAGLELEVTGSGTARAQNPAPGSRVESGGHVAVQFSR